ncbi:hypothetical protein EMIT043CA1_140134 [Pseudomonas brassicacearum]
MVAGKADSSASRTAWKAHGTSVIWGDGGLICVAWNKAESVVREPVPSPWSYKPANPNVFSHKATKLTSLGLCQGNRHVVPFAVVFPAQAAPGRGGAAGYWFPDHCVAGLLRSPCLGTR